MPGVVLRSAHVASSPMRRMTSLATPRASTGTPAADPCPRGRRSQWASAGPAMLAPATNTLVPLTAPPARPSGSRSRDRTGVMALAGVHAEPAAVARASV
jgi:hypothetical protein